MKIELNIWTATLLLSSTAGFCDTSTFVAVDQIFSAHVTGNFIVFAYEVIRGSDTSSWIRLSTFPVFIISVLIGGWVMGRSSKKYALLIAEGTILIIGGLLAWSLKVSGADHRNWATYFDVMLVVFGMGFQNAFGKIFSKETYGPTTVMTGNVTQAALDIFNMITSKLKDAATLSSFKRQFVTIGGFLIGCLAGAVVTNYVGLTAVALPGLIMVIYFGLKPTDHALSVT